MTTQFIDATGVVATDVRAQSTLRRSADGAQLWLATLAVSGSTAVILALVSRSDESGRLATASAVFVLTFVIAVVPGAYQMRAATEAADGSPVRGFSRRAAAAMVMTILAAGPVLHHVAHLSVLTLVTLSTVAIPMMGLAVRRGQLLGTEQFGPLGRSFALEALARVGLGVLLGVSFGAEGIAAALVLALTLAWALTPATVATRELMVRPVTPLPHMTAAMGLVAVVVNLDVVIAPGALGSAADEYAVAAVPARGVFFLLIAVGMLAFPYARRSDTTRALLVPAGATLGAGALLACGLVLARGLVATLMDRPTPEVPVLALLAVAMAFAAGTSVCLSLAVARGDARPWPPLVVSAVVIAAVGASHPTPVELAVATAAGLGLAFVAMLTRALRTRSRA